MRQDDGAEEILISWCRLSKIREYVSKEFAHLLAAPGISALKPRYFVAYWASAEQFGHGACVNIKSSLRSVVQRSLLIWGTGLIMPTQRTGTSYMKCLEGHRGAVEGIDGMPLCAVRDRD